MRLFYMPAGDVSQKTIAQVLALGYMDIGTF